MDETNFTTNGLLEIEITDDSQELMKKVFDLEKSNEELTKQLRNIEHKSDQKLNELQIENEKLQKTIKSQDSLIQSLKEASSPLKSNIENAEYENNISQLESKNLLNEQSILNLKRQNQNLSIENSNLKFEIEKLQMNEGFSSSSKDTKETSECSEELTLEEAKTYLSELMTENDDLKREIKEMGEKALEMLTEKEVANLEMKEKLDEVIEKNRNEVNLLLNQIHDFKEKITELEDNVCNIKISS